MENKWSKVSSVFKPDNGSGQGTKNTFRLIRTRLEGREVWPFAISLALCAAIGIPLGVMHILTGPIPNPTATLIFAILGLISSHIEVVMPSGVRISPGNPIVLGALFRYGLPTALITIMPSFLLHFFTRKHGLLNCLFNAGQFALCLIAADFVGAKTGWQVGVPANPYDIIPIITMILIHDTINILLVAVPISIDNKKPFSKTFVDMFYYERRSSFGLEMFLCVVSMLISSYLDYLAPIIMLVGVMSLRLQTIFEKELVVRTKEAQTDQLTGLYNLRHLETWLETDFESIAKKRKPCSFIFADIDGLKTINDTYGHLVGDLLLIHVAQILKENTRGSDSVVRYGGDEFVISCPATDIYEALAVAHRILESLRNNPFIYEGEQIKFGMSLGVATWPAHGDTGFDVIRTADKAMYLAKKQGGNLVRTATQL
ncbi:MAG: GGDEF domain-containing protein [Bacillota bacterium]